MNELLARLQSHPLAGTVFVAVAIIVAMAVAYLAWIGAIVIYSRVRGWLAGVRHHLFRGHHRRTVPLKDPVYGDTAEHDAAFDRGLAEAREEQLTGELAAFAAAPAPGCADDCQTMMHTGPMQRLEPLPEPDGGWAWQESRPVRTVNLPPWDVVEDPGFNPSQEHGVRARVPRDRPLIEAAGAPSAPTVDLPGPKPPLAVDPVQRTRARKSSEGRAGEPGFPLGATHRDGMSGSRDLDMPAGGRSPESGSLSPRTAGETPVSVTAGRATTDLPDPVEPAKPSQSRDRQHLPGPAHGAQGEPATAHAVADETRRAGKARRIWSGLLGHDPLSLVIPGRTASPAPEPVVAKAGQPVRDGQRLPGQDARVLTGEVIHGPAPDDAPTVININIVSITVQAGDYDYDALQFINDLKARYAAEHRSLRAWSAEIEDACQRELTGASA